MMTADRLNRTARKSTGGTVSTRSRMRKNVDPHTAVKATRSSVARRVRAAGVIGVSDDREGDGAALGHRGAGGDVLRADLLLEEVAERVLLLHLEAEVGQKLLRDGVLLVDHVG